MIEKFSRVLIITEKNVISKWNVISFGVDNSSLSHSENHKNNFLILGKGATFGINWSFGSPEKNV